MGYVKKSDRMAISYSVTVHANGRRNCPFISSTSEQPHSKVSHRDFRLKLVRNMVELAGWQPHPLQTMGRPSALATRIGRLEDSSRQHWPPTTERIDCAVRKARTKRQRRIQTNCENLNAGFCIS
jgi:hypothetical protein